VSGYEGWEGVRGGEGATSLSLHASKQWEEIQWSYRCTDSPSSLPTCYHGYCEDGRRDELELGLITSLDDGIDEITESCYHGNSQQHLEGEIHV